MTTYKNFEFESQGARLAGYEWATEKPQAVVYLIHGIGEHSGRYEHVAEYFNNAGIGLMAMDLRGHGRSPGKRGHIGTRTIVRNDIDNLIDVVKQKYPDIPLIHYGHSLGGNISLDYRLKGKNSTEPDGYLITSPWIKLVRPIHPALYKVVKFMSKIIPEAAIGQSIKNEMLGDIEIIEREEGRNLRHQKISLLTAAEGYEISVDLLNDRISDMYGGSQKPVLLMHGSNDPICSVEGSRAIASNYGNICEYIEWKDYLHELHNGTNEKSDLPVLQKMTSWISSIK